MIEKYKGLNKQIKIVFWFTFVGFLQKGISLITTPIFTRILSVDDYGLYSVFNAYYTVLIIVASLYLHMGVLNNALTKLPQTGEKVVSAFQSLSLVVSSCLFIIAILFRNQLSTLMGLPVIIVVLMFFSFMFKEPYSIWIIKKRYSFDYVAPVIFTVIISILTPVISIIAIFMTDTMQGEARIVSYLLVNSIVPGIILYIYNYRKDKTFYDKELWTYALAFNLPLILHYLSETLLNQTDRIMINAYFGSGDAGIYSVAFSAAAIVTMFSSAMNTAFVPWTYQKIREKQYATIGNVSNVILTALAIIIAFMTLFAPEVIYILAGENYMGAVSLIPTLACSVYFGYMYQLFLRIELYYEKKSYTVIATLVATALNILLNIWWLPIWGYKAAGYSTLLAHILFCIMHYIFYRKIISKEMESEKVYNTIVILSVSISLLLFSYLVTYLYAYVIIRIVLLIIMLIGCFLCRNIFKKLLKQLRKNDKE